MVRYDFLKTIPSDIDIEVLLDITSALESCCKRYSVLTVNDVMHDWYELILIQASKEKTMAESDNFIHHYFDNGLTSDMRSTILSMLDVFSISIFDQELEVVVNTPQFSLLGNFVRVDNETYNYSIMPGGDWLEYSGKENSIFNRLR